MAVYFMSGCTFVFPTFPIIIAIYRSIRSSCRRRDGVVYHFTVEHTRVLCLSDKIFQTIWRLGRRVFHVSVFSKTTVWRRIRFLIVARNYAFVCETEREGEEPTKIRSTRYLLGFLGAIKRKARADELRLNR